MVHTRSQREIDKIARSCQIVADTLNMLEPHVIVGAHVSDLDQMAEDRRIRINLMQKKAINEGATPAFDGVYGDEVQVQ